MSVVNTQSQIAASVPSPPGGLPGDLRDVADMDSSDGSVWMERRGNERSGDSAKVCFGTTGIEQPALAQGTPPTASTKGAHADA